MTRGLPSLVLGIAAACAAAMPFRASADPAGEKVRAVVARHAGSLVRVSMLYEMKASAGGQSLEKEEMTVEFTALSIDPSGLFLCADFGGAMAADAGGEGITLQMDVKSCKILLPDGKEFPARAEWRDDETHLLFVRAEELAGKVPPIPAEEAAKVDVGDAVVILDLLSNRHPEPCARMARVNFRFRRPFTMFRYDENEPEPGQAAFDLEGRFVGVTSLFQEGGDGGRYHVVIPAERVKALLANARTGAAAPKAE